MAKTVSIRELRSNLSSLLDDVSDRRDHVLSDPDALSALEAGLAEIERGETVTLAELRSELAERRPTAG